MSSVNAKGAKECCKRAKSLENSLGPVVGSDAMAKRKVPRDVRAFFQKIGKEGGRPKHRAEIPPEQRKAIAQKAARARWAKKAKP